MTFRDLQKIVQQSQSGPEQSHLLQRLTGKPLWIWDSSHHKDKGRIRGGNCCFNHIIGLPRKDGVLKPFFDYEKMWYMALLEPGYLNSTPSLQIQMILQA